MGDMLALRGVTKRFPGFTLEDIGFSLPSGFVMGLIGPNGAGKTTIIKLILNMLDRDGGDIALFGMNNIAEEQAVKRQIGIVMDASFFVSEWRVRDVASAVSMFYANWSRNDFDRHIKRFDLPSDIKIKDFSRGMQMKLMLACAFSHDAKLLILDEPTSGLDPLARDELLELLQEYIEDGAHSVLFSTHITADLERIADYIAFIMRGKMYFAGSKDDFLAAFRIVRGRNDQLTATMRPMIMGYRKSATGFEGLIHTKDASALRGCVLDPASIDEIMVYAAKEEKL